MDEEKDGDKDEDEDIRKEDKSEEANEDWEDDMEVYNDYWDDYGFGNDHYNQCKKPFKTGNLRQLLIRSIKPPVFHLICYISL